MRPLNSNLSFNKTQPHTENVGGRRADVEGFFATGQGAVDASQRAVKTVVSARRDQGAFQPSMVLRTRAIELSRLMHTESLKPKDLRQATEQMILEGHYLQEARRYVGVKTSSQPDIDFEKIGRDLGLSSHLANEVENLRNSVLKKLALISQSQRPTAEQMKDASLCLQAAVLHQTELFAERAALYDEVLKQKELSKADRAAVLDSELSFSSYSAKTKLDIPYMIVSLIGKAESIVKALQDLRKLALEDDNSDQALHFSDEITQWDSATEQLKMIQESLGQAAKDAADQAGLAHLLNGVSKNSGRWSKQALALTGQSARQGALSGSALGAANYFSEAALTQWPIAQPVIGAIATALTHEVGTHLLGALILETIGGATQPVNGMSVLPAPNRLVSIQGEVRSRTTEELENEQNRIRAKRLELSRVQNAHKLGSLEGDARAWVQFALAQGVRGAASIFTSSGGPGAATLASIVAGILMGGVHAVGGLRAKVLDDRGRAIPAYVMKPRAEAGLSSRLKKTSVNGLSELNYFQDKPRKTLQDKTSSLAAALASIKTLDLAPKAVANHSQATQSAITGIATGAKSILLLSQYWAGLQIGALTKADACTDRALERQPSVANYERFGTAWRNMVEPNRSAVPNATKPGSKARLVENAYTIWQGASQLVPTALSDTVESSPAALKAASGRVGESLKGLALSLRRRLSTDPQPATEHAMVDLEAQRIIRSS